jgi:hypothetical protein
MQINQQTIRDIKRRADTKSYHKQSDFRGGDVCLEVDSPAKRDEAEDAGDVARYYDLHANAFDGEIRQVLL